MREQLDQTKNSPFPAGFPTAVEAEMKAAK
jgi:hypothetical protein